MQILLLLLIGAVALFGYRKFVADAERLARSRRRREEEERTGATGTLVKDPETGEYRLKKSDD